MWFAEYFNTLGSQYSQKTLVRPVWVTNSRNCRRFQLPIRAGRRRRLGTAPMYHCGILFFLKITCLDFASLSYFGKWVKPGFAEYLVTYNEFRLRFSNMLLGPYVFTLFFPLFFKRFDDFWLNSNIFMRFPGWFCFFSLRELMRCLVATLSCCE